MLVQFVPCQLNAMLDKYPIRVSRQDFSNKELSSNYKEQTWTVSHFYCKRLLNSVCKSKDWTSIVDRSQPIFMRLNKGLIRTRINNE